MRSNWEKRRRWTRSEAQERARIGDEKEKADRTVAKRVGDEAGVIDPDN